MKKDLQYCTIPYNLGKICNLIDLLSITMLSKRACYLAAAKILTACIEDTNVHSNASFKP